MQSPQNLTEVSVFCLALLPLFIMYTYHVQAALDVQMKAEQQSTEGISGILATIEQEQGMVWFSLRLPMS